MPDESALMWPGRNEKGGDVEVLFCVICFNEETDDNDAEEHCTKMTQLLLCAIVH